MIFKIRFSKFCLICRILQSFNLRSRRNSWSRMYWLITSKKEEFSINYCWIIEIVVRTPWKWRIKQEGISYCEVNSTLTKEILGQKHSFCKLISQLLYNNAFWRVSCTRYHEWYCKFFAKMDIFAKCFISTMI